MDDSRLTIHTPKKRGRPPASHRRTSVSAWILEQHHDRLIQLANQQRKSVSELIDDAITRAITKHPGVKTSV